MMLYPKSQKLWGRMISREFLISVFMLIGCANDEGPWILHPSRYKNNEALNASLAEEWFNKKYDESRTDWITFTSFNYQEDENIVAEVCKQKAYGCIPWFFELLIWDTSDDYIRCTAIQHEFGHMGAWLYGVHDGDPDHKENPEYFNKYVFEVCEVNK